MKTDRIEKRLEAIEHGHKEPVEYILSRATPEGPLAYMLSNGMKTEEPGVFELHWKGDHLQTDAQKIRWLRQYTPAQIDEIRREWEESTYERDKVALRELVRLQAETSEYSLIEKQAEDQ
jgi:hypothetical protein